MAARAKLEVRGAAARLRAHAEAFPGKRALIYPDGTGYAHQTYRELDDESDAYAAGLRRVGIGKGTKTVLMLRPGPELFAVLFALIKVGAVPVVVDPGMGVRRMLHCYRAAGADAFIGVPPAHAVRVLNRRTFAGVRTLVTAGRRWFWGGHTLRSLAGTADPAGTAHLAGTADPADQVESAAEPPADGDLLMIGFTTGSTGPAKGVESTHGALDAMVRQVAAAHGQGPDDVGLVTSPLFGILHLLIGSTCVLAPVDPTRVADADPAMVADLIDRFGVTAMFASPALLDPLGRHLAGTGRRLPTLRCLVSGGAPVSDDIVSSLHSGQTRLHVTYGATEALPISSIDSSEILGGTGEATRAGHGTCVGRPVADLDVRIVRVTDEPMPTWSDDLLAAPGQVGEITIAGPTVSRRYHALPAANLAAKIADGDRVWHRTGDLGRVDGAGRIWFCGRKSQRVQTAAGPMDTVRCEGILDAHRDVYRTALVGVDGTPVVCVQLRGGVRAAARARVERELRELAGRYGVTRPLGTFLFHRSFPVDIRHNAKINREYLSRWAKRRLGPRHLRELAPRIVPVAGWTYLAYGLAAPFDHPALWTLFWVDAFASVVVHGVQLPTGVRRGRLAGYPAARSALLTVAFGATWWRALP